MNSSINNQSKMWKFPLYEIDKPIPWDEIEAEYIWFQDMKGVPQDKIWHAEGDVYVHTKMVVEALINLPEFQVLNEQDKHVLFTSALMHDIEKRSTTTTEILEGIERTVSPRHAKKENLRLEVFCIEILLLPLKSVNKLQNWFDFMDFRFGQLKSEIQERK